MIHDLSEAEIDRILRGQRIGRIGSTSVGHVQITPIVYGYDGSSIYGHSRFGRKIQYMRGNPDVCFEVEEVVDPTTWAVVVLHGHYSELQDLHERDVAMRRILAQGGGGTESSAVQAESGSELVIYRIAIHDRAGRREGGLEDA